MKLKFLETSERERECERERERERKRERWIGNRLKTVCGHVL